jgi:hypothetical protein
MFEGTSSLQSRSRICCLGTLFFACKVPAVVTRIGVYESVMTENVAGFPFGLTETAN